MIWLKAGNSSLNFGIARRRRLLTTNKVCASTVYAWNRSYCMRPTTRPNEGM